jgi:hypothetical protein
MVSTSSTRVIERAAELCIHLPKVLVKVVSECLIGKIPSDWDQPPGRGPELLILAPPFV